MKVLVTGGAGYIGSHTCVELINAGHSVVIIDNLSNSCRTAVSRIRKITGKDIVFYEADVQNKPVLHDVLEKHEVDAVIHFAGYKSISESIKEPLKYYENNVAATLTLCEVMKKHNCKKLIFSSSAAVYGEPAFVPITEECPKGKCTNAYARSKWILEQMLCDLYTSDNEWNIILLRYFNPVGAHKSGLIGEDPVGIINNLIPYISQVAIGKLSCLYVFGNDYNTPDGTGVRDYIHVVDLAKAHTKALKQFEKSEWGGVKAYNIGTGKGFSVMEMIRAFEKACGHKIKYKIKPRREGDVASCYCDPTKANLELGWKASKSIEEMCADFWKWQTMNPNGYNPQKHESRFFANIKR